MQKVLVPIYQVQGHNYKSGVFLYKWCIYSNSKTAEANLINFIERSTKVRKYVTQNFCSDYPDRGHNQVSSFLAIT